MVKKIVIITGGLGEIGHATALCFGKNNYRVALCDQKTSQEADSALMNLKAQGCSDLLYTKVDVVNEEEVKGWLNTVVNHWGVPQVIILNAGIVVSGKLTSIELSTKDVKKQIDVNFWGAYHVAVLAAKKLKEHQLPGRIIFIGSWVANRPIARISPYGISKAAIRMLSRTLALELAEFNILVNEIAPGIVAGGLSKANQQKDSKLYLKHLESIPVHQLIPLEEVVQQIWQISDFNNTSITGSIILLDGGLSLTSKMTP
jgi:glucose 1-dehydrogenase